MSMMKNRIVIKDKKLREIFKKRRGEAVRKDFFELLRRAVGSK